MIFTDALFAPTVPSLPRPKNTAETSPAGGWRRNERSIGRLRRVTSSTMPTVKCGFGRGAASSSKTGLTIDGVSSLDDSP